MASALLENASLTVSVASLKVSDASLAASAAQPVDDGEIALVVVDDGAASVVIRCGFGCTVKSKLRHGIGSDINASCSQAVT